MELQRNAHQYLYQTKVGICFAMRNLILAFGVLMLVGFCACDSATSGKYARRAAVEAYEHIIAGEYSAFVSSISYCDSMTGDYRAQFEVLVSQYADREKSLRGGLLSVQAVGDTGMDETALVFLEVMYGDSTFERISVPMVHNGEVWKLQ